MGGNCITSLIGHINPSAKNLEETVATLKTIHRAKFIVNKAEPKNIRLNCILNEFSNELNALKDQYQTIFTNLGATISNSVVFENYMQAI